MKKSIIIVLALFISSCGIFKRTTKKKVVQDITIEQSVETISATQVTDRSITTTTEKIDTVVSTLEVRSETINRIGLNMDSLVNGFTAISNDLMDVKLSLDSAGNLHTLAVIKSRPIGLRFDRTTTKHNDISTATTTQRKEDIKIDSHKLQLDQKNEPDYGWIGWTAGSIGIFFVILAMINYWRKRPI